MSAKMLGLAFATTATLILVVAVVVRGGGQSPMRSVPDEDATSRAASGPKVYPFRQFDFSHGRWPAYVLLSPGPDGVPAGLASPCLRLNDPATLGGLRDLSFIVTGGDLGTPETNMLVLMKDSEVVQLDGLLLLQNPTQAGIQRLGEGYLEAETPESFLRLVNAFEPVTDAYVELPRFEYLGRRGGYRHPCGASN